MSSSSLKTRPLKRNLKEHRKNLENAPPRKRARMGVCSRCGCIMCRYNITPTCFLFTDRIKDMGCVVCAFDARVLAYIYAGNLKMRGGKK